MTPAANFFRTGACQSAAGAARNVMKFTLLEDQKRGLGFKVERAF